MFGGKLPKRLSMLTKLGRRGLVMEWLELISKAIGLIVTILSACVIFAKYIKNNTNSIDFQLRFGVGRNVKGLGCMRFFRRPGALSSRDEVSHSVKKRLTREIAKDVVHAYSIERRSHRFSRDTRDFVSLMVTMFIISILFTALVGLSNVSGISPAKQPFVSFALFMLGACICAFCGFVALQFYFVFMRMLDEVSSSAAAEKAQLVRVPLESIPYCVEKESDYIFVDATIRKFHQVPFMGTADRVHMLLDHGAMTDEIATLQKSEAKQIKADNYEEVVAQLVDSFLTKTLEHGSEPVCFVFSQAGITAVLVTQLLRSKGLRAFYIGATNGYESEVREAIREIRILRESGLI